MSSVIPKHIAIIMDGNGRWAERRGLPRAMGHRQGVEAVKRTVREAKELGVKYLTLFGFSSENWNRPEEEVRELMRLLRMFLRAETADLHNNNVKLKVIGNRQQLERDVVELIENTERLTINNTSITVVIAINYGGRNDILEAASQFATSCIKKGLTPDFETAEEFFPSFLSNAGLPDPEILIRTSGERRVSNFLLWQLSYAELYVTETYWPDFREKEFFQALESLPERSAKAVNSGWFSIVDFTCEVSTLQSL